METTFDVIIIGGSYAGMSAAMALGRSLRRVLVIDSGEPCNRQTPNAHNFLTHDGHQPAHIARQAVQDIAKYQTVTLKSGLVTDAQKQENTFTISTWDGDTYTAKKLLFATGMLDLLPDIEGFKACWGISVLHCPYCHGYEVRNQQTGIIAFGEIAFEYARLISNWTNDLTLFTNGPSQLTSEQMEKLDVHKIEVVEKPINKLVHHEGHLTHLEFKDGTLQAVNAVYHRPVMKQHCELPQQLGCELTEMGHIKIDTMQATTVNGVYAAGDNATMFRSLAVAIADGNKAGAVINKTLIDEEF